MSRPPASSGRPAPPSSDRAASKREADTSGVGSVVASSVEQLWADPAAARMQALDKIAAARVWLLKEKPFFGVLARALVVEPSLAVAAFRVTADDRLLCNPLVCLEVKFPTLCARIAHLAMHAALGAFVRRGAREALRWNAAHDLAIQPLLRDAGLLAGIAPGSTSEAEIALGASAEQYYELLPEGARPDDLWCDLSDPPSQTPPAVAGAYTRRDDGEGDEEPEQPRGSAGTAAGPPPQPEREGDDGDEQGDDGDDRVPPVEARARALQWKMRLGAALEEERASGGKTFGEIPAWIDEMVQATIEPPPSFAAMLQRSVSMLTRTDRSFLRPSRRMSALAGPDGDWPEVVAMPGRQVRPAGQLVCVIDTSASVPTGTLARFLGTLAAVATAEGFDDVRLVQADAEVTHDETLAAAELLFREIPIVGRGGTDFGPALRLLAGEARRERSRFTVAYLTDLDGRFPPADEVHPLEVLWVVPGKAERRPPFGKLLEMSSAR